MRDYDETDLNLIMDSPARFTIQQWQEIGPILGWFRQRTAGCNRNINNRIHLLMRAAIHAYARESLRCPWDDDFNRRPPVVMVPVVQTSNVNDCVLAWMVANPGRQRRAAIVAGIVERGYAPASVDGALSVLMRRRLVERIDAGIYDVAPAGKGTVTRMTIEVEQ